MGGRAQHAAVATVERNHSGRPCDPWRPIEEHIADVETASKALHTPPSVVMNTISGDIDEVVLRIATVNTIVGGHYKL